MLNGYSPGGLRDTAAVRRKLDPLATRYGTIEGTYSRRFRGLRGERRVSVASFLFAEPERPGTTCSVSYLPLFETHRELAGFESSGLYSPTDRQLQS